MKKFLYLALAILSILIFNLAALAFSKSSELPLTQQQLNDQALLAINWFQQSGEYRALTYQAFNAAKLAFEKAVEANIPNPAVVVDLDETILNNSAYQASLIDTEQRFSLETWNRWILAEEAKAVPGATDFVNYVNSHSGTVFFVSSRDESSTQDSQNNDLELATIRNLQKLGMTGIQEETVLLRGEFTQRIEGREDSDKKWRQAAIRNGLVDGISYNIVMFVGDNLNDLFEIRGHDNQLRRNLVDETQAQYGVFFSTGDQPFKPAYITLPNPIYGSWENSLYDPQRLGKKTVQELTPTEQSLQRKQALIRWHRL